MICPPSTTAYPDRLPGHARMTILSATRHSLDPRAGSGLSSLAVVSATTFYTPTAGQPSRAEISHSATRSHTVFIFFRQCAPWLSIILDQPRNRAYPFLLPPRHARFALHAKQRGCSLEWASLVPLPDYQWILRHPGLPFAISFLGHPHTISSSDMERLSKSTTP